MMTFPSAASRCPARSRSRIFTSSANADAATSKRSSTAVATLFTFWPPGPDERTNRSVTKGARSAGSSGGLAIVSRSLRAAGELLVVFLQRLDGEVFRAERRNRADRRGGPRERGDGRHALHHRDAAHRAIVEERLPPERRVDDERDAPVEELVTHVR